MSIPFKNIPSNLRVPLFYAELDNSQANTLAAPQRALLIGQITAEGTLTANVPVVSQSQIDSKVAAGAGSILAGMIDAYRANDPSGEMWVLPLADDAGATAATGTATFTGPSTAAGTISLYIAGQLVAVPIASGTSEDDIATAVAAAVNASSAPVTAALDGTTTNKVDFTARNKGLCGNDIDLQVNYRGASAGEALPAGVTVTFVAMSAGATNPGITTALANLQDTGFDFIVCSLTDTASLAAIAALLSDATGRWSWSSQVYGHCWVAYRGTAGANATFATDLNNQHITNIPFMGSPSPNWAWSAAFAGQAAVSLRADPGVPLQTLKVAGLLPPPLASQWSIAIRNNTLLFGGCSTWTVDAGGNIVMENIITTYVTNEQGEPDDSYLEVETLFLIMYVLRALKSVVTTKYARVKLAADGVRLLPGSNVVTPSTVKADIIATYRTLESQGFVQNSAAFAAALQVEKNAQNPNRLDVLMPATLIDQLRVFAVLFQFRLQ